MINITDRFGNQVSMIDNDVPFDIESIEGAQDPLDILIQEEKEENKTAINTPETPYKPYLFQSVLENLASGPEGDTESNSGFCQLVARELVNEPLIELEDLFLGALESVTDTQKMVFLRAFFKTSTYLYTSARFAEDLLMEEEGQQFKSIAGYNFNVPDPLQQYEENKLEIGEEGFRPSSALLEETIMVTWCELSPIYIILEKVEFTYQPSRRIGYIPFGYKIVGNDFSPLRSLEEAYDWSKIRKQMKQEQEVTEKRSSLSNIKAMIAANKKR